MSPLCVSESLPDVTGKKVLDVSEKSLGGPQKHTGNVWWVKFAISELVDKEDPMYPISIMVQELLINEHLFINLF